MADQYVEFFDTIDDTPPPMASGSLFGHQALLEGLIAEFNGGKLHHATILSGAMGIGKATLAFHFAKQIFVASGEANAAEKIEAGTHPSLLHISRSWNEDTKKFRTEIVVGDVHRANHFLSRTASGGGTRIIIIDCAEDMNRNAANALLKNLEEPPEKTHYFLISHATGKLLPTIRSRCRVLNVPTLTDEQVIAVLTNNLRLSSNEAADLALYADGSVRQAMTMARYGGIDIAAAFNAFIANKNFSAVAAQNLATAVSDRESEPRYILLTGMIEKRLAEAARSQVISQKGNAAAQISLLYQSIQKQRAIAEGYKLDRKLEVFNTLRRVHAFLALS